MYNNYIIIMITTGEENETQILLNAFTMWCNWAKMSRQKENYQKKNSELSKGTFIRNYQKELIIQAVFSENLR